MACRCPGPLDYDGDAYDGAPAWAAHCFTPCLVWLWDERLYDRARGEFTVEAFLEYGAREFGGFDAVVLWHAYPVIGIDERNQWDYYRDVSNLAEVVDRFHREAVAVFVNYNPWDVGTRRASGSDSAELAALVADYGVDGVFLDTLKHGDPEIIEALADEPAGRSGRRVASAAGRHRRTRVVVGAMVRRLRSTGRAAGALVRATPHDASHTALEPRPQCRVAVGVGQRMRRAGLG